MPLFTRHFSTFSRVLLHVLCLQWQSGWSPQWGRREPLSLVFAAGLSPQGPRGAGCSGCGPSVDSLLLQLAHHPCSRLTLSDCEVRAPGGCVRRLGGPGSCDAVLGVSSQAGQEGSAQPAWPQARVLGAGRRPGRRGTAQDLPSLCAGPPVLSSGRAWVQVADVRRGRRVCA